MVANLYGRSLRFECLKLAHSLVHSKQVKLSDLEAIADRMIAYIDCEPAEIADPDFAEVSDDAGY